MRGIEDGGKRAITDDKDNAVRDGAAVTETYPAPDVPSIIVRTYLLPGVRQCQTCLN